MIAEMFLTQIPHALVAALLAFPSMFIPVSLPHQTSTTTASAIGIAATSSASVITNVKTREKVVALTFDADMTPGMLAQLRTHRVASWYNEQVIEVLTREQVPATLFLTGMWIETYATATRALSNNPLFELGNHSYSHGGFTNHCYTLTPVPESHDVSEVEKTDALLSRNTTRHVKYFRFPGLCADAVNIATVHALGYTIIGGDVHGNDGFEKNRDHIVTNVLRSVRPGSIVVLHMHGGPNAPETARALPIIIQKLRAEGYTFKTVSELLHDAH